MKKRWKKGVSNKSNENNLFQIEFKISSKEMCPKKIDQ